MLYKLLCLHRDGVALSKHDLFQAETYAGNLVIDEWGGGNAFGRTVRRACLLTTDHSVQVDILPPQSQDFPLTHPRSASQSI